MNDENYGGMDSVKVKEILAFIQFKVTRGMRYLSDNGPRATLEKIQGKTREYGEWLMLHEKRLSVKKMQTQLNHFPTKPRFSCLINGKDLSKEMIEETCASLNQQGYPFWEGILFGTNLFPEKMKFSKWQSEPDFETAVNKAVGDYCIILCGGDLLPTDGLFFLTKAISEDPEIELLYGDEDFLDDTGCRRDPRFKPDWCPDSILSQNYIGYPAAIRASVLKSLKVDYDFDFENQYYDLLLKATEKAKTISHISEILCHRRASSHELSDVVPVLEKAIHRRGLSADVVSGRLSGIGLVTYKVQENPKVSILMPMRDHTEMTQKCIDSVLLHTDYKNFEIIAIDNGSVLPQTEIMLTLYQRKLEDRFKVLRMDIPFNYSKLNNAGAAVAAGDYLLLLNNDIEILSDNWIETLLGYAQQSHIGAVGAKLYFPDKTIQHGGVIVGLSGVAAHAMFEFPAEDAGYCNRLCTVNNYSAVTAAMLMVSKEKYVSVDGLDEKNFTVALNDVDFCLKLQEKGLYNVFLPMVEAIHYESKSRGKDDTAEKRLRLLKEQQYFRKKWHFMLDKDPCYNPNLTFGKDDFSLK